MSTEPARGSAATQTPASSRSCPACGGKGKPVGVVTVASLITGDLPVGADGFQFCASPGCDVAYFHPDTGLRVGKGRVRVRIGQKETGSPRPVCYCFDHTVEEIEGQMRATGTSTVPDAIAAMCKRGLDHCEETNPQGSCCLGNVHKVIQEARMKHATNAGAIEASSTASKETPDCCREEQPSVAAGPETRRNVGLWATAGAVVAAIFSSACCWLPLLLIAFGVSTAGVAGFFEAYRVHLLGATGLLLAVGFYLVYFRKGRCGPGTSCAAPDPKLRRLNKGMLWVATAVVLVFALFPNYVGAFLGSGGASTPSAAPIPGEARGYAIEGMTCEGCAVAIQARIARVPGVTRVEVLYDEKVARVWTESAEDPSDDRILDAIAAAGYRGTRQ
ncbi:MAG: cation transporter [Planctomycetes bacterium]|nr:cation transporter [Planctomycetota bacterium]